jgi:DNA-directed RNA polymerase specialized sigma24 family protein
MLGVSHIADHKPTPYATGADFCRIFKEDMDRLYLLSFLLTGDQSLAEKCFVRGLEDAGKGNPVFKEWAHSWARRTVIQKAIEIVQPRPAGGANSHRASEAAAVPPELAAVVDLLAFERFVFVMSVLEHNSDQECSLLLDCSRAEVAAARIRALQQIGNLAQLHREAAAVPDHRGSALHLPTLSHLPVSA